MSNKNSIFYNELELNLDDENYYDSEGYPISYNYEDSGDDFGFYDFEKENKKEKIKYCKLPQDHKFVKKLLFYSFNRECSICGYSPELDYSKKDFEECHRLFINWEKNKK